jgi:hypothetical protein
VIVLQGRVPNTSAGNWFQCWVVLFTKEYFPTSILCIIVTKLVKCYIWSTAFYGTETWTLWKVDEKYLESFKMWCWRRKKMNWTNHVRNEGSITWSQGGEEYLT